MRGVLDALRAAGPTERELAGARNRSRRQLVRQLDSVGRRADVIAHSAVYRDDPEYVNTVFERYDAIGESEIAATAERVLDPDDGTALHVIPEETS
jgi:predicted Zn-dependent peptidase